MSCPAPCLQLLPASPELSDAHQLSRLVIYKIPPPHSVGGRGRSSISKMNPLPSLPFPSPSSHLSPLAGWTYKLLTTLSSAFLPGQHKAMMGCPVTGLGGPMRRRVAFWPSVSLSLCFSCSVRSELTLCWCLGKEQLRTGHTFQLCC